MDPDPAFGFNVIQICCFYYAQFESCLYVLELTLNSDLMGGNVIEYEQA